MAAIQAGVGAQNDGDGNILVSAAAGAGKTAVVVEHILRLLSEVRPPVSLENLLVVTFTEAAAEEMRERVGRALEERLSRFSEKAGDTGGPVEGERQAHLKRQLLLLNRANISTLHSFCLKIIRTHFYRAGLDPSFRVAAEEEAELLKLEVLDDVLEKAFADEARGAAVPLEGRPTAGTAAGEVGALEAGTTPASAETGGAGVFGAEATGAGTAAGEVGALEAATSAEGTPTTGTAMSVTELADALGGVGDQALGDLILQVYDFAQSHPWPEHWLKKAAALARRTGNGSAWSWLSDFLDLVQLELEESLFTLKQAKTLAALPGGPGEYLDNLEKESDFVGQLLASLSGWKKEVESENVSEVFESWETLREKLRQSNAIFGRLKPARKGNADQARRDRVRELRDKAKKRLKTLAEEFFGRPLGEELAEMDKAGRLVATLVDLVLKFGAAYKQEKRRRNLVDFNDLEHLALEVLTERGNSGEIRPSAVARELRTQFVEVIVDEYQDTNHVQELILNLISRQPEPVFKGGADGEGSAWSEDAAPVELPGNRPGEKSGLDGPAWSEGAAPLEPPGNRPGEKSGLDGSAWSEDAAPVEPPGKRPGEKSGLAQSAWSGGAAPVEPGQVPTETASERGLWDRPNLFLVGDLKQSIYRFRQTDPGLFREKLQRYRLAPGPLGKVLHLPHNFRSRAGIVNAVNYLFRQLFTERVGELVYDKEAALVYRANYPEHQRAVGPAVEVYLLDVSADAEEPAVPGEKSRAGGAAGRRETAHPGAAGSSGISGEDTGPEESVAFSENEDALSGTATPGETAPVAETRDQELSAEELSNLEREAWLLARRIKEMVEGTSANPGPQFHVFDREKKAYRPVRYRDIVLLLRAVQQRANVFLEVFNQAGIPAYADLGTGYFAAPEVETILSLLRIIDNPHQDIPLATVLHSPIGGFSTAELVQIRLASAGGDLFTALRRLARRDAERKDEDEDEPLPLSRSEVAAGWEEFGGEGDVSGPREDQGGETPADDTRAGQDKEGSWESRIGFGKDEAREPGTGRGEDGPREPGAGFGEDEKRDPEAGLNEEGSCLSGTGRGEDGPREPGARSDSLALRAARFLEQLKQWRTLARRRPLGDLIWQLYRDTGYLEYVGGLPGGRQRQANLRALLHRARQFEGFVRHDLFRFLRFIERLQKAAGDLGTARALGEKEDVVRIMSIHRAKGLEFPVVVVASLGQQFNAWDLNRPVLLHPELGLTAGRVDLEKGVKYDTLAFRAVRHRLRSEALSEELRILYVALTRAREKLILTGTVKKLGLKAQEWAGILDPAWVGLGPLPDLFLLRAKTPLDWLGPALFRHPDGEPLRKLAGSTSTPGKGDDGSSWRITLVPVQEIAGGEDVRRPDWDFVERVRQLAPPIEPPDPALWAEVTRRLDWRDPLALLSQLPAKMGVTELKRRYEYLSDETQGILPTRGNTRELTRRPAFLQGEGGLTAAERGTLTHLILQHLDLTRPVTRDAVEGLLAALVEREVLTPEQVAELKMSSGSGRPAPVEAVVNFFATPLGQRLLARPDRVYREIPFTLGIPVEELGPDLPSGFGGTEVFGLVGRPEGDALAERRQDLGRERVLVQGIIDCLVEEEDGFVLLDFKTGQPADYRKQLELYRRAVETIYRRPVKEAYLYFLDSGRQEAVRY